MNQSIKKGGLRMRELKEGLILWRVVYLLGERQIECYKLIKELKTRWRCKYWVNGKYRGEIGIEKHKLKDKYVTKQTRREAIQSAIERNRNKLKEYEETIPLIKKEIEELEILLQKDTGGEGQFLSTLKG